MNVLLDTHTLLWAVLKPDKLGRTAARRVADLETTVYVSAASAWEIATKVRLGRLSFAVPLERDFVRVVTRVAQYTLLPVSVEIALRAGRLPGEHGDPFDRMLAAQALALDVPIVSMDGKLDEFGVSRIW